MKLYRSDSKKQIIEDHKDLIIEDIEPTDESKGRVYAHVIEMKEKGWNEAKNIILKNKLTLSDYDEIVIFLLTFSTPIKD